MSNFKSLKALGIYTKVGNEKIKQKYKQIIKTKECIHNRPEISKATRQLLLQELTEIKDMNDEELFNYIHFNTIPPKEVKTYTRIIYHNGKKVKQITQVVDGITNIYILNKLNIHNTIPLWIHRI